jgi:DNA replication protein DnaC
MDRATNGPYFLSSPQLDPQLHRMCTGKPPLPLAQIASASAKFKQQAIRKDKSPDYGTQVMKVLSEVCSLCEGTGWKSVSIGSERRVTRCDCRLLARTQALLAAARIPKRYEHCELSNFESDGPHRLLASSRLAAGKFVEEYPVDSTGLLLIGSIGVGKTHLAVGIIKELILSKGIACLFYDYRELLKQIQNSYNDSVKATELEVLRPVFETEVLVLDELGAVKPTEWVWDTVSLILNARYNDNRTTIITSNFDDRPAGAVAGPRGAAREETLGDRIGERMRSRLHEMCRIIKMEGEDFRQKFRSASFR